MSAGDVSFHTTRSAPFPHGDPIRAQPHYLRRPLCDHLETHAQILWPIPLHDIGIQIGDPGQRIIPVGRKGIQHVVGGERAVRAVFAGQNALRAD